MLQRALILQNGETLKAEDIAFEALSGAEQSPARVDSSATVSAMPDSQDLRSQEQRHILDVLEKNQGSRRLTARELVSANVHYATRLPVSVIRVSMLPIKLARSLHSDMQCPSVLFIPGGEIHD